MADAAGLIVVAPTDPGANEGYRFTREERETTLAVLRWARRTFDVDENRIHLTGISRGGHLAWDLALRHPDRFASLAPMIGSPRLDPRQNNLRFVENVAHLPIRDLQGERDDPRMVFNLRLAFDRLRELGAAAPRTDEGVGDGLRRARPPGTALAYGSLRSRRLPFGETKQGVRKPTGLRRSPDYTT